MSSCLSALAVNRFVQGLNRRTPPYQREHRVDLMSLPSNPGLDSRESP